MRREKFSFIASSTNTDAGLTPERIFQNAKESAALRVRPGVLAK